MAKGIRVQVTTEFVVDASLRRVTAAAKAVHDEMQNDLRQGLEAGESGSVSWDALAPGFRFAIAKRGAGSSRGTVTLRRLHPKFTLVRFEAKGYLTAAEVARQATSRDRIRYEAKLDARALQQDMFEALGR